MNPVNIPIQLVAACSTKGDMTPLWFRFENEEHQIETIKIEEIVSHRMQGHCGMDYIHYVCAAETGDTKRWLELRYHVASHRWSLFRVLS